MSEALRSQPSPASAFAAFCVRARTHLRTLGLFAAAGLLAGLLYALLAERIYSSTATLVMPRERAAENLDTSLMVASLMQDADDAAPTPGLRSTPPLAANRDLFLSVLECDSMDRAVVARFELRKHYGVELTIDAVDILRSRRRVTDTENGTIEIEIEDTVPEMAAAIANLHGEFLNARLRELETTEASKQRAFIERRIAETDGELEGSEEALKRFQEENRAFALSEQARGLVEEVALLKGEIIAEEAALEAARMTSAETSPDIVRRRRRIDAMKRKLEEEFGDTFGGNDLDGVAAVGVPFQDFPQLGLELGRLVREVEIQSTVFTLLTRQLEEAKIAEARDMPKVQWIDRALPAELPERPLVGRVFAGASLGAILFGILIISARETVDRLRREYALRMSGADARPEPSPAPAEKPVEANARVA